MAASSTADAGCSSRERKDMERLAPIHHPRPLFGRKDAGDRAGPASASGSILHRCGMNKKIRRNFEVFTPCDFIAAITQHIADKRFQLVRYYGRYSNKMRGRRPSRRTKKCRPRATPWR